MKPLRFSFIPAHPNRAAKLVLAWLLLLAATCPALAQRIGATVDESNVQVTYYVKPGGSDANSGLTAELAVANLGNAVDKAKNGPLSQGRKTKIVVAAGTYACDNVWAVSWPGQGRGTVLIIEGAAENQVVLRAGASQVLSVQQKDNLVIRNLVFVGGAANGSLWGGMYHPFAEVREHDWLVDQCHFKDAVTNGFLPQGIDNLTVQNCTFTNNRKSGLDYIGRYGKFVNLTATGNGSASGDVPGIGFAGFNCSFDNITASDNRGPGFRMDHACENVTISNSKFERNGVHGLRFETCIGPVLLKNCLSANNKEAGLILITAHGVTVDGCRFVDNGESQVLIHPMDRSYFVQPDGYMAGNLNIRSWMGVKPMVWVKNTKVINSTFCVTQPGSTAKIYKRLYETSHIEYAKWFKDEYQGSNNKYTAPSGGATAFDVSVLYFERDRTYADLVRWQRDTGEDANSTFSATCAGATALPTTAAAEQAGFSLYPNPAQNQLTVELPAGGETAQLRVVDAAGRLVLRQAVPAGARRHTLALPASLAPGLYLLRLDQGRRHLTQRFARE
jgi:hypothetical protein